MCTALLYLPLFQSSDNIKTSKRKINTVKSQPLGKTMQENTELSPVTFSDESYQKFRIGLFKNELNTDPSTDRQAMNNFFVKAAQYGDLEVIKEMIQKDYCDSNAKMSLTEAIKNGHLNVVKYLLPYNKDKKELEYALCSLPKLNHFEITKTYLEYISSNNILMPMVELVFSITSILFNKKQFDIALLFSLVPQVKSHMHGHLSPYSFDTKSPLFDIISKIITFKKDCKTYFNALTQYSANSCLFFNAPCFEIFPIDIKKYVINIGLPDIKQQWGISQTQLKNIYSIKDRVLADIDEPTSSENNTPSISRMPLPF